MTLPEYPPAVAKPLPNDHWSPGTLAQRNLIVLHITTGPSDVPGGRQIPPVASMAINTFFGSKAPNRVSAHFVVDRDGTVYQLVSISDSAWHASEVNSRSIGIETSASADGQFPATDQQYESLAQLVKWCAGELQIPVDRDHVRSHNEASPRDGHVKCCTGGLDPDRVVAQAAVLT